ncbi:MAG TPA: hypothetical protein VH370_07890 [Humisphaera sp.]|jgi:transcriptional regulator|nr:hypothetical protein [Humisphaera sp.]
MIPNKVQTLLTDKQLRIMRMRYDYRWRLKRIAREMGITEVSACLLLQRAHLRAGYPRLALGRIKMPKPRARRAVQLSQVFNY